MNKPPLPLPEAAFSSWQSLTRDFGRSLRTTRQYGDASPENWTSYEQTLRHVRRILHPARIDQHTLAREKSRQMRDDPDGDLVSDWAKIAEDYAQLGFAEPAEVTFGKVDLLQQVDWDAVLPEHELENKLGTPAEMQPQFDVLYETERKIAQKEGLDDIRAEFASRTGDYTVIPDEAFNTLMVETLHASTKIKTEITSPAEQESIRRNFASLHPQDRKDFAKSVIAAGVPIFREIWAYLPSDAFDITRRGLWIGDESLMLVVETPQGTDDDPEPYPVDVTVSMWPSGAPVANFTYEASTKASRAAALAAGRLHIDQFMDAAKQLTDITDKGRLAWLHKLPLIGPLLLIITMALHPRMTFRFFRGMARRESASSPCPSTSLPSRLRRS